eukprot:s1033_g5.t1
MPLRLYLLQLVIWGFPVILCSGTLLLVPAEPLYWRPVVAGAANGVFTLSVEALRIWLHRRPSEPGAPKAAWFADDDGLDFQLLVERLGVREINLGLASAAESMLSIVSAVLEAILVVLLELVSLAAFNIASILTAIAVGLTSAFAIIIVII